MSYVKNNYPVRASHETPDKRRESNQLGLQGEQLAADYLTGQGYAILERNYRKGRLEIDLIALDNRDLVIVEVKTRTSVATSQPEDAVDHVKRRNIINLANQYVKNHHRTENVRFDIVSVLINESGTEINHFKDAFNIFGY